MAPNLATKAEATLPKDLTRALAHIWADNGDACSIQYAGTAALKGKVILFYHFSLADDTINAS